MPPSHQVKPHPPVPRGIVAAVFVADGMPRHTWFPATYMPPGLRCPVAAGFVLFGLATYGPGLWTVGSGRPQGPRDPERVPDGRGAPRRTASGVPR
ncbi:hypothetical protein [Streptosporangium sandarakinum]|uniref:hypothetical protein n=1 Tax=Streptosporangium sandarakinum TaxID=1260955 RepID=UPI00343AFBB6